MKTRRLLIRMTFPLLTGVGLIAVALWLMGAMPAGSASNALLVDLSSSIAPAPLQAQGVITILQGTTVTTDGRCDPASEYGDAASYNFDDVSVTGGPVSGTVYLKHDSTYLYVCMRGPLGGFADRFASVYLDTTNDREGYAGPQDFALHVGIVTPTLSSYKGTGVANGYVATTINGWAAAATTGNNDVAEYAIPINVTGGWCGAHFGLAVYHHWVLAVGNDYGWPGRQYFDQPHTWQEVVLGGTAPCSNGKIAYVYKRDTATAGDFKSLLESNGFTVQLIPLGVVTSTDFTGFNLVIVADDTGSLDTWGTGASQTTTLVSAGKPIVGLGEGGYAFFGQLGLGIGWPHGWHGPQDQVYGVAASLSYYHTPYEFAGLVPGPFPLYGAPVNEVGIYLPKNPNVLPIGLEPPYAAGALADHAPLIAEKINADLAGCNQLWGYSGGPKQMNPGGGRLFVNAVTYGLAQATNCTPPPPPPTSCVTLSKSATPPNGTHVKPGDTISYTLTYTVSSPNCNVVRAELVDKIPIDTLYVPNSASGGGTLNTGTLIWNLGAVSAGTYTQTFQVYVLDTQCHDQRRVNNVARLQTNLGVVNSNLVTLPVDCPPVTFPNNQPPYAEDDIQIYPYPLVTGKPTQVSARIRNLLPTTQTVTVTFQASSSNVFGIGLNYATLPAPGNPKVVTLPPLGQARVQILWTPTTSGHYCIYVTVEGAGFQPILTAHNLDVSEDLRPGVTDVLTFSVGNPTPNPADVLLVVDNTCPGWTALVAPSLLSTVGPNDTDIRTAQLSVTPPLSVPLGTACHIDVQGWINGKLIGGIRKFDVPPVQLPPGDPWWEEKEISVNPDPPTAGQTISYCVELQNPLPYSRTVDLVYSYADFGAGIPFTPIETKTVTLPPNSIDKYCINWATSGSGTLHRCLLITLKQPGFQDQRSQRNVDFVRPIHGWAGITVTFGIENPDPFTRTLKLVPVLVGIDPNLWIPHILPDPPPDLGPNQKGMFTFELVPAVTPMAANATPPSNGFGDSSRVEVGVYLDDEPMGGFTVDYTPINLFLPIVMKP